MSDYFLYLWTITALNSGYKRQFRVKSRLLPVKDDYMAGLEMLPAGLFLFLWGKDFHEGSLAADRNAPTLDDYYKTSEVQGNRP